jgi:hypothetical protein
VDRRPDPLWRKGPRHSRRFVFARRRFATTHIRALSLGTRTNSALPASNRAVTAVRHRVDADRRAALLAAAVVVVVIGGLALRLGQPAARPISVARSQISAISAAPWPEGPGMPSFALHPTSGERPLSLVLGRVPIPLPSPSVHGAPGGGGGVLTVTLRTGRVITYGPHDRPPLIDRLWGAVLEADQLPTLLHRNPASMPTLFHRVAMAWIQHHGQRRDIFTQHPRSGQHSTRLIAFLLVDGVGENPRPYAQPATCDGGDTLVVQYRTGRRVTYGPCVVHPFIEMLWGGMQQAAAERRRITTGSVGG